ncbi:MAG: Mut7-C RNAse domain-containing protein, partial [Sulfuricella sp.]
GHAFSRCILDNTFLEVLKKLDIGRVPDDVRLSGLPLMRCPNCGRVYWRGSHYRRMMGRLLRWQGGDFA